ncbi:Rrf2 family transcriptional regulator [Fructobacillus sp. W13]|uniref:Rrf2 family transcriptional regulator n=1 Tax=Fructobacillus apis TaxID=2935017 RepID=A0ABT0ZQ71_9LACO|nr:Rrf2 family transcriptional regulator [Fructobacillus apis]MCO0832127.1 Rrf2 family transcriptional regulator [Fructobacillus apis]
MKPSMKLTNAVHVLLYIARKDNNISYSSKAVAESVNTNPSRIRAIMAELTNAAIIKREGGPMSRPILARPASEISLADILKAVDSAAIFQLDSKVNQHCPLASQVNPALAVYYQQFEDHLLEDMENVSLGDLIADVNQQTKSKMF